MFQKLVFRLAKIQFLDEIIVSDDGKRSYICSDTDYCKEQRQLNSKEEDQ